MRTRVLFIYEYVRQRWIIHFGSNLTTVYILQGVSCLVHMLLLDVTDNTRSGHRLGHQGSAHEPNSTRVVQCMFYEHFFPFPTQWCWL